MRLLKLVFLVLVLVSSHQIEAQIKVDGSGNVGINVNNPKQQLHLDGNLLVGKSTTGAGGILLTTQNSNSYNLTQWGIELYNNGLNFWRPYGSVGWGNYRLFIKNKNGYVGIGLSNPSARLHVNGFVKAWNISLNSDERLKEEIKPLEKSLERILQLESKSYFIKPFYISPTEEDLINFPEARERIDPEYVANFKGQLKYGFIAQEVEKIIPEIIQKDEEGMLSMDYISIIPFLVESIKELNHQIKILEDEVDHMNSKKSTIDEIPAKNMESSNKLFQNEPNPFHTSTRIKYAIEESVSNANIGIYDLSGNQIKLHEIHQRGNGALEINAGSLKSGIYIYNLILDGREVMAKRMVITN